MPAQGSEPRLQVSRVPQCHVGVVGTRGEHSSVQKPEENTNLYYCDVYTKKLAENQTLKRIPGTSKTKPIWYNQSIKIYGVVVFFNF
jgi:hypothetical protein